MASRIEKTALVMEEGRRNQTRWKFLQENIDQLVLKLCSDPREAIREKLRELESKQADTRGLQDDLDRLSAKFNSISNDFKEREGEVNSISKKIQLNQGKLNSLFSLLPASATALATCAVTEDLSCNRSQDNDPYVQCPIASEIRCETDLRPYKDVLILEMEALELKKKSFEEGLVKTRKEHQLWGEKVQSKRAEIQMQRQANDVLLKEMRVMQDKLAVEERAQAKAQGMLEAYREEWNILREKGVVGSLLETPDHTEADASLNLNKNQLLKCKQDEEEKLMTLLREQGRASVARELLLKRNALEAELKEVQVIARLLGPEGIQGEIARQISGALEKEVNDALKLIDADLDFTFDLNAPKLVMGWNRNGKVIPFKTINSAHFILLIVPFLAVILKRMGCIREREGLPTLKVLCIEAESMTVQNLLALLKGLSIMKEKEYLDNVLVAHYTSIRDPEKLSGFKEHILTVEGEEVI